MDKRKSIFITGAASGIGRETALFFSTQGWFTGIYDINESGLSSLQAAIGKDNCITGIMNVTDVDGIEKEMRSFAAKTDGRMDVLFNCAGILKMGLNETIPLSDQHLIVDVNLKGILNCIHCALPFLKETSGAHIINMASGSILYGTPDLAVYSATKHAVRALTEALDIELERYKIILSDITPPYVNTPMVTDAEVKAYSIEKLGVPIEPIQVARTVWKASHRRKLHWNVHFLTRFAMFIFWLLPFAKRFMIKKMTMPAQ